MIAPAFSAPADFIPEEAKKWGTWVDGRPPPGYEVTQFTAHDFHVGAWSEFRAQVLTSMLFDAQIYFHPVLMQCAAECIKDYDKKEDSPNIAAIPIPSMPEPRYNSTVREERLYYRLWLDLSRPCFTIDEGSVFVDPAKQAAAILAISTADQIGVGDTIFVLRAEHVPPELFRVVDINVTDKKYLVLDRELDDGDIWMAGWVVEGDSDEETVEHVRKIVDGHLRLSSISPPRFAGVCGPLQPVHYGKTFQFFTFISGNAKMIVDHNFFNLRDWMGGDPIDMLVGYYEDDREYNDVKRSTPEGVDRLELIFRHPEAVEERWHTVWSKPLGTFIIQGDTPWLYAAYVLMYDG